MNALALSFPGLLAGRQCERPHEFAVRSGLMFRLLPFRFRLTADTLYLAT